MDKDTRIALKSGTLLRFYNKDNMPEATYTIQDVIGRGRSGIVYNASYIDNVGCRHIVLIKECYPFFINLARDDSGRLLVAEGDREDFRECRREMEESFRVNNELFLTDGLTNLVSNTINWYEANNTSYIVSTYMQGEVLSCETVDSIKDCVLVVKSVAAAIRKMHDKGYLYLDIKPENIFVLEGSTQFIRLFDFDSLIPLDKIRDKGSEGRYRISCTKGFAALEQQRGRFRMLGRYTDVFGIGALLFYLLFGRVPEARDCETDAEYRFADCRFADKDYQDRLFQTLPDFFHHTLAASRADRYQDMDQVIFKLEEIEKYADTVVPFIISSQVSRPGAFVGRDRELAEIDSWMNREGTNCLFLTGMGGIGKSALVREYIADHRRQFDAVLYLYYNGSVQRMLSDDGQVRVNVVERREEETTADYFYRKLKVLRDLAADRRVLLVVDDFDGDWDRDFAALLDIDWKVIIVSRKEIGQTEGSALRLRAIPEQESLYTLFEGYARREIGESEEDCLDAIIAKVSGHTLALQLIARQVECSHLSIPEAAALLEEKGFSDMAPEKVDFAKDQMLYYETISTIISALFESESMSWTKRAALKALSLFPMPGIEINVFSNTAGLETKDELNELIKEGWVDMTGRILSIHPVVREVIRKWEWAEGYRPVFARIAKILLERILDGNRRKAADHQELYSRLRMAEGVLEACQREVNLREMAEYSNLLYGTIMNMPHDREEYILKHADELLRGLDGGNHLTGSSVMDLYDRVITIQEERGNLERAAWELENAERAARRFGGHMVSGQYYMILIGYYDAVIGGDYGSGRMAGEVRRTLQAADKAIRHLRREKRDDSVVLYAKALLSKAHILICSHPEKRRRIRRLLDAAKEIAQERAKRYPEVRLEYNVVCGWYHTLVDGDYEGMMHFMENADEIVGLTVGTDLSIIDDSILPWSHMLYEFGRYEESASKLKAGIQLCEREEHRGMIPYVRKKMDLYACLLDVYYMSGDFVSCREVLGIIDAENEANREVGVLKVIEAGYRGEVLGE